MTARSLRLPYAKVQGGGNAKILAVLNQSKSQITARLTKPAQLRLWGAIVNHNQEVNLSSHLSERFQMFRLRMEGYDDSAATLFIHHTDRTLDHFLSEHKTFEFQASLALFLGERERRTN